MPTDLPRRELASAAELDVIMLALTSPRRAWVERAYGSRAYRVFIVNGRLRRVPFGAYGAAELARAFAWLGQARHLDVDAIQPDGPEPALAGPPAADLAQAQAALPAGGPEGPGGRPGAKEGE